MNWNVIKKAVSIGLCILLWAFGFVLGVSVEQAASKEINHNTYCANGTIVQRIDDEYLLEMENGHYFSFSSDEEYADNTAVVVCFDIGKTDAIEDDLIIAVSVDNYALTESLFNE